MSPEEQRKVLLATYFDLLKSDRYVGLIMLLRAPAMNEVHGFMDHETLVRRVLAAVRRGGAPATSRGQDVEPSPAHGAGHQP
jgi:hypothetical protein